MKNIMTTITSIILIFVLTACSGSLAESSSTDNPTQNTGTSAASSVSSLVASAADAASTTSSDGATAVAEALAENSEIHADPADYVWDSADEVPIAAQQGVSLVLDLPESTPDIQVDEGRMLQVLKNLVDNALRYTPGGGKITLSVTAGERVEMRVTDSGSGIEAADLPYVFERFYRADPSRGGSSGKMGLGLAICKALVTAQGGEITAESAGKDQGTRMIITLQPC